MDAADGHGHLQGGRAVHGPGSGLPEDRPRYVMGIGYPLDILVCSGEWRFAGVVVT